MKKTIFLVILFAAVVIAGCAIDIEYRAEGTAEVNVYYKGEGDNINSIGNPPLPFTYSFSPGAGYEVSIAALILDNGAVAVEIYQNGKLEARAEGQGTGAYIEAKHITFHSIF